MGTPGPDRTPGSDSASKQGKPPVYGVVFVVCLLAALATGFHALIVGNIVYAYYKYVIDADKQILRAEEL